MALISAIGNEKLGLARAGLSRNKLLLADHLLELVQGSCEGYNYEQSDYAVCGCQRAPRQVEALTKAKSKKTSVTKMRSAPKSPIQRTGNSEHDHKA
jgi:hypothetical protein